MDNQQSMTGGSNTGTRDSTYDLTAVLYHALQGVENCQIYMGDAQGQQEHRQFFQQACDAQKQLAEQAKRLLHDALMKEQQGGMGQSSSAGMSSPAMGQSHSFEQAREDGSAFRFASSETEGGSDQFAQAGGIEGQQSDRQPMGSQPNDPGTGQFG